MGSPLYDDAVPQPYDTGGYSEPDDEFSCGDPDCSCRDDPDDDAGHGDDWRPIETIDTRGGVL